VRPKSVQDTFTGALDGLLEQVKQDRAILAAVLCGSLSHDTVWARSDIDLLLITVDDRTTGLSDIALNADGVNVHALLMPRSEFRRTVEGSVNNSFFHSFLAKGRLRPVLEPIPIAVILDSATALWGAAAVALAGDVPVAVPETR